MEQHQEDGEDVIMEPAELEHECDSAGGGGPLMSRRNAENVEPAPSRRVVHLVKSSAAAAAPKVALVQSTAAAAANKLRIDRIAENLKINLQQKEAAAAAKMKEPAAPKVSVVALAPAVKPPVELAKRIKEEDELERHDADLTNLAWLGTFNLAASVGLPANYPLSLSPPISPPLPPPPVVSRVQVQAARPVQVQVRKYAPPPPASAFSLSYGGDEADGGGGRLKDISALLKPYLSSATAAPSPSSKAAASLQRPPYSFSCLTFLAIESSQRKRLSVKEIYNWITQNFPYYRSVPSGSWKNSIRHNLSYNHCFAKVDKNLLAMRDFSGKGSLWCINPEYRPLLVDTLLKMPMNSEQHQLACIPFLQDVAEVPKSSTAAATSSSSSSSNLHDQRSSSLTPSKAGGQVPSRTKPLVKHRSSSLIGHKTPPPAHQLTTTIINPRIASRFMASGSPPVVSQLTTQIAHRSPVKYASKQSSKQAADHSDSNCSEMDAVNALLSMKSNRGAHQQPTPPEPKTTPPTSRRKQVFKTPTKKLASKDYAMDDDSDESWNEDNFFDEPAAEEQEEDIDQPEPSADQEDDDDEIEEGQVLPPTHHLFKAKRAFELPTTSSRAAAAAQMTSKKAKLLVKFPCFKSKAPAAQDEDDEHADETANMNALLELSLAAKLVEQQKQQQQLFKPVQSKRVRKN